MPVCESKYTTIGSDNGLSPGRHKNAFENVVFEMVAILSRRRWVKVVRTPEATYMLGSHNDDVCGSITMEITIHQVQSITNHLSSTRHAFFVYALLFKYISCWMLSQINDSINARYLCASGKTSQCISAMVIRLWNAKNNQWNGILNSFITVVLHDITIFRCTPFGKTNVYIFFTLPDDGVFRTPCALILQMSLMGQHIIGVKTHCRWETPS